MSLSGAKKIASTSAAAVAMLAALSGCGISDLSISPGIAAKVGDDVVTVDEVDALASPTCEVLAKSPNGLGTGLSGETLRNGVLIQLVLKDVFDQIAAENGVDSTKAYNEATSSQREALGALPADLVDQALPVLAVQTYVTNVRDDVLAKKNPDAAPDSSGAATQQLLVDWQKSHQLEVNPMFTQIDFAAQTSDKVRQEFSVAVSDAAKGGLTDSADQLGSLPASQKCVK